MQLPNGRIRDLTTRVFERLTVKGYAGKNRHGQPLWGCLCVCGEKTVVPGVALVTHNTRSCGCLQREVASEYGKNNLLPDGRAAKNAAWNDYLYRCQKKKRVWGLSKEAFEDLITRKCHYCGSLPMNGLNGIDRLDSSRGYEVGNVTPCCSVCNRMKGDMPMDKFLEHILLIQASHVGSVPTVGEI